MTVPYEFLAFQVTSRIATITINRPDKLNALSTAVMLELNAAIDEVCERDDIGGVILTGAGRAFVAGGDLEEVERSSAAEAHQRSSRGQHVFNKFESSHKPTVAAINGFALGGGCELAMACHIRIASESARFGQPETKLGLIPGYGATHRLPHLVGKSRALELLLSGDVIGAAEAYRIGLVNRVVAPGQLMPAATALLHSILANGPLAIARCIGVINTTYDLPREEANLAEAKAYGLLADTDDRREGTRAFLEKRPPVFRGS